MSEDDEVTKIVKALASNTQGRNKLLELTSSNTFAFGQNPSSPATPSLAQFFQTPIVRDLWFHDQAIVLDGYHWINCRFDRCALTVKSEEFELEKCFIDEASSIRYEGKASRPIKLFLGRFSWSQQMFPDFVPIRHADGTISIG